MRGPTLVLLAGLLAAAPAHAQTDPASPAEVERRAGALSALSDALAAQAAALEAALADPAVHVLTVDGRPVTVRDEDVAGALAVTRLVDDPALAAALVRLDPTLAAVQALGFDGAAVPSPEKLQRRLAEAEAEGAAPLRETAAVEAATARRALAQQLAILQDPTGKPMAGMELDTDRPGIDYTSFDLAAADPALCRAACQNEAACAAWTYVHPGVQGPAARCWLKSAVPAAVPSPCCVSGVNATAGRGPQAQCESEGGTWRPGGLSAEPLCFHPMPDAGQPCDRQSECVGHCLLADPAARQGQCSAEEPIFGCYDYLDEAGRRMGICVD